MRELSAQVRERGRARLISELNAELAQAG